MSPELVLVDAELAAELRRTLRPPAEPLALADPPTPDALPDAESGLADDLIIEPTELLERATLGYATTTATAAPEPITADEYIVLPDDERPLVAGSEVETASSHYPLLPALDSRSSDQTDAALRQIREQLAGVVEPPASPRVVRRRFIVAAGASAVYALTFVTIGIQLGFVHMSALALH